MLEEVQGCPAKTAISAISPKNCEKLEKSQFLLKLIKTNVIKSSGTGGRRLSSKNCDFSKNCEKLEKSQILLKLGGARVPSKNCDFCKQSAISQKISKN